MTSRQYAVVEFDDGVSGVPEKWLTPRKTHCYWPLWKTKTRTLKAAENQEDVDENCSQHKVIKILALTKTFKRGQQKCSQALLMPDVDTNSDADNVRFTKRTEDSSRTITPFPPHIFEEPTRGDFEDFDTEMNEETQATNFYKIFQKRVFYPVTTDAELEREERRLSTDNNYKNNLIKYLGIFVQSDVKNTVSQLMQKIISNCVAVNYSFHGAHKKKAFEKLKLYAVISSVVRCRFSEPVVVNRDISDPIESWLRHAPARLSREKKKATPTNIADDLEETTDDNQASNNKRHQANTDNTTTMDINNDAAQHIRLTKTRQTETTARTRTRAFYKMEKFLNYTDIQQE